MHSIFQSLWLAAMAALLPLVPAVAQSAPGTLHVDAFDLPLSGFLNPQAREAEIGIQHDFANLMHSCPLKLGELTTPDRVRQFRTCWDAQRFQPMAAEMRARYKVDIQPRALGGVNTEVIMPAQGVSPENADRVLINVHGGGFFSGARWAAQLEAVPIAATGRIKVVAIDYRLAPEARFPAASEDLAAVYQALLKDYRPQNIGIYGCSAGGLITAEGIAWFVKQRIPLPGAIGVLCYGALPDLGGDSETINGRISGIRPLASPDRERTITYFADRDLVDPLAFPALDDQLLARFPPTLLISSTRDLWLSNTVETHRRLIRAGVDAELHIWEGLGHGFFVYSNTPAGPESYDIINRFFKSHLGTSQTKVQQKLSAK